MNQLSSQNENSKPGRWCECLVWVLVLLACALSISPNVADPDLWGHVQYGRDVLADGGVPATTSYSFTAENYRWVNHENLSEIFMAITADSLGPLGLVIGKLLLGMGIIGLMIFINRRNGVGMVANAGLALLVASNLAYHWSIRPQISSFVCFGLLLALIHVCFAGWQGNWHLRLPRKWFDCSKTESPNQLGYDSVKLRWLWLVAPIFWIWANSHGGFVAGLCIFSVYMLLRGFEALNRRGNAGWGIVRRMALMTVVAVLATFVNPYGFGLHAWLVESLGRPRPEILDWNNFQLFTLVGAKFWFLLAVVVFALAFSKRRHDATQWIVMTLVLWQSLAHFRHVPFFALMVGFWVGPHLHSAIERVTSTAKSVKLTQARQKLAMAGLLLAIGILSLRVVQRISDLRVERDQFPVAAVQYMHDHNIRGRMVVTYNWAQYAIGAFCVDQQPSVSQIQPVHRVSQVAFDGRFRTAYPQTVVDMHFDFLYGDRPIPRYRDPQSGEIDPGRVLEFADPEIVLLSRRGEFSEQNMEAYRDRWLLLYQDAIAQVWGVKRRFGNPEHPDFVAKPVVGNSPQTGSVTWPAFPIAKQLPLNTNPTTLVKYETEN